MYCGVTLLRTAVQTRRNGHKNQSNVLHFGCVEDTNISFSSNTLGGRGARAPLPVLSYQPSVWAGQRATFRGAVPPQGVTAGTRTRCRNLHAVHKAAVCLRKAQTAGGAFGAVVLLRRSHGSAVTPPCPPGARGLTAARAMGTASVVPL